MWGFWLIWLPFLIQPITAIAQMPPSLRQVASAVGLLLFLGVYLWATWQEAHRLARGQPMLPGPQWRAWAPIGLLALLSVVLPFVQGTVGLGGFIYTSASVAGRVTPRRAAPTFGGLMALVVIIGLAGGAPWATILLMLFLVPAVGIATASFSRTVRVNQELRLARQEIVRLAVSEERLRFARDLHDLLGHTLSLIALKSELAGQIIPEDPAQGQREVRDIEAAAREALKEVREAVAGYRQVTLANEMQRAQELLAAAGVQFSASASAIGLPSAVETLLAWVVREGVTNVIRHSRARHCALALVRLPAAVRLTITNDGVGQAPPESAPGNGLRGIAERVAALAGQCASGPDDAHGFRLTVELPLPPQSAR